MRGTWKTVVILALNQALGFSQALAQPLDFDAYLTVDGGVLDTCYVSSPLNGWLVLYRQANTNPGQHVAYKKIEEGEAKSVPPFTLTKGVKVAELRRVKLIGQLHRDRGTANTFEYSKSTDPDEPVIVNGRPKRTKHSPIIIGAGC
jgi:hypothetical protein